MPEASAESGPRFVSASFSRAAVVLGCRGSFAETLAFFTDLGFRMERIWPADAPGIAELAGHGCRLRLDDSRSAQAAALMLAVSEGFGDGPAGAVTPLVAPNGVEVSFEPAQRPVEIPPLAPECVLTRARSGAWITGRAGMRYRDLLPTRLGGRFIASHIRIEAGGPVPDQVHFHRIRLQFIFCRRGWVRVVYEDQGEPFLMEPGDCVLQPPGIRHRVLESSPGLEVIELACPAEHETLGDLVMNLPNGRGDPERRFGSQRFAFHRAAAATPVPISTDIEALITPLASATDGLADVRVLRAGSAPEPLTITAAPELELLYLLAGQASVASNKRSPIALAREDCLALPPGERYRLTLEPGAEMLAVSVG